MEFEPLTTPGTRRASDMALVLSSTPNSYVGIKSSPQKFGLDQESDSLRLFNSNSHNDSDKSRSSPGFNKLASPISSSKKSVNSDDSSKENKGHINNVSGSLFDEDMDDDDDPIICDDCNTDFPSLQQFLDHKCSKLDKNNLNCRPDPCRTPSNASDLGEGESFDGRIVYNPDGSAYILEDADSNLSDLDSLIGVSDPHELIVDKKGSNTVSQVPALPHIANAIFVPRNSGYDFSREYLPQAPIMFSYKVYDMRSGKHEEEKSSMNDNSLSTSEDNQDSMNVPTKPILMCFICKLSFGYSKSFIAHAVSEHSMEMNEEERKIMNRKNSSAIIQCVGTKKEPLLSFLEPRPLKSPKLAKTRLQDKSDENKSPKSFTASQSENTKVSFVHSKPKLSDAFVLNSMSNSDMTQGQPKPYTYGATNLPTCVHSNNSSGTSTLSTSAIENLTNTIRSKLSRRDSPSASLSPVPSMSPVNAVTNSSLFLGICDEHPQGRVQGVECPKCDIILGSSQSLGGHMTMMHSRNSCKTLKCPKCNWHYKYQETLEIHMKEKHPEGDQQCIYCLSNQSHPRLARGESYSCGYKPYRCEVCNYSTTTKGNLSIHMQSDKHLNNVQDLANGTGELKMQTQHQQQQQQAQVQQVQQQQQQQQQAQPIQQQSQAVPEQPPTPTQQPLPSASDPQLKKNTKPKPTWRCDVCNYETNVARNLRIHMTSEKHTHNMMVLQQNMKHMQRDIHIQQMNQMMLLQNDPAFMYPNAMPAANMPFNMEQSMYGPAVPHNSYGEIPMDLRKEMGGMGGAIDPQTPDSSRLYSCCVCNTFVTDSLESLHQHLQVDRTKQRESETISVSQGTYICNLCSYKTNLKANFQLHCKTDKHLQRLQLVNHIKEGGANNEWRLKYLNVSNPVQVRCNSCDYYTNSIHKLQIHSGNPRHEKNAQLFCFLQLGETKVKGKGKYYHCTLCNFSTRAKLNMIQHVRAMRHLHNEQLKQMKMQEEGVTDIDPGEIFQVREYGEGEEDTIKFDEEDGELEDEDTVNSLYENDIQEKTDQPVTSKESTPENCLDRPKSTDSREEQTHTCPYCTYSSPDEMRIQAHITSQHSHNDRVFCPLCQEDFKEKLQLEKHLMNTHSVKPEGLHRLLLMVDQGDFMMPPTSIPAMTPFMPIDESGEINTEALEAEAARLAAEEAIDTAALPDKNDDDQYRCQTCSKTFSNIDGLYAHQNELGHLELKQTPRGPGYLCWKKGCNQYFKTAQALQVHFREIHAKRQPNIADQAAYKYECNQCSLAFKSTDKFQLHSHFHLIQAATRCSFCSRSFRSIAALRKHVDTGHSEISEAEKEQYHASMNVASMALGAMLKQSGIENISDIFGPVKSEGSTTTVNAITSPVVSLLQSDKLLSKTDMNSNETIDKMEESMEVDNSSQDENEDDEDENMDSSEREDNGDVNYKEQQFMEDYINSPLIAENSYEDPARKFKCHKCKVAFTKQNYLTAHNKTLLHRRGEKMSYPMEKYLDPNRPFKCDVCKESFTQKNILLVHYNSVSHLHKLKQITQGSPTSAEGTDAESPNTSSATVNGENDNKSKPYKCNICKVSYSQGINLDNHIRSVCHQTKASKLQELVLTGQVDIMQPLIEQPHDSQMSQQQKLLSEMLAQQSAAFSPLLFPGMPGFGDFGFPLHSGLPLLMPKSIPETVTTSSTSTKSTTSIKSEKLSKTSEQDELNGLHMLAQAAANNDIVKKELAELVKDSSIVGPTYLCQLCNAVFTNQDSLQQHQVMCMYQAGCMTLPSPMPSSQFKQRSMIGRVKPQVHRNLLENIGFECVMQFNEFNNQPSSMREEAIESSEIESEVKKEIKKEEKETESEKKTDLPELNKGVCPTCHKEFSSVWVLKAHQEEVHKDIVPTTFVEDFGEQFKNDMDLKQAKEAESLASAAINDAGTLSTSIEETKVKDMPPPPPPPPLMGQHMDISQMMPMFNLGMPLPVPLNMAMMNMQPQLMPMMFPVSSHDGMTSPLGVEASLQNSQPKMTSAQQAAAAAAAMNNQKRARTRINDEQLKVLRGYFDINNSPSEEQIIAMSEQSGLPTKVIKHWFRNTLFKERQRNKDSPYNFNNPPLTTLDLEEYEKTGKIPANEGEEVIIKKDIDDEPTKLMVENIKREIPTTPSETKACLPMSLPLLAPSPVIKQEPLKLESPRSQESLMEDSDSMSNSSMTPITTPKSAPPPLININMSSSLPFNTSQEEIRPRFEFSPHHTSYNKRANRTRFTDYQIKVLQEYFEQNAYPKDDELDHLSKVLNLSPRVIVVWFQNARQKARKIYENQPNADAPVKEPTSTSPFNRTAGLNYQCKKCTAVFQRYYDLIRHQKKHCSSESDKGESMSNMNDESNSNDSFSSTGMSKDDLNQSEDGSMNSYELSEHETTPSTGIKFNCEKCNQSFDKLDAWRDHQNSHITTSLFAGLNTSSAFNVLQNMAAATQQDSDKLKRKFDMFDDDDRDQQRDKRLRTTILPEQLDYLYQKYQLDCNPSRKQLENISRDVNLKKRVVQVWFQNTRARERKGQYRAHQQLIHKRCPFCRALFRAKSALESHLATKHPEEMAKGDINIDNIPDAALESPSESLSGPPSLPSVPALTSTPTSVDFTKMMTSPHIQSFLPILPSPSAMPGLPTDPLQLSMNKYYSESFKKYMNDLSAAESSKAEEKPVPLPSPVKAHETRPKHTPSRPSNEDDAPLDLSKPLKVKVETEKTSEGPSTDISESSSDNMNPSVSKQFNDSASDVSLSKSDYYNSSHNAISTSGPNSPGSTSHSNSFMGGGNKRYRTQMTSLQVRIMKTIFVDYKTPTMAECEMLGRIIGLQKRVVQVWFQNARAKEKKSKLQMSKTYGTSPDMDFHKPPEECKLCNFKYSHKYTIQDHIFTKKHIENVRNYVQSQSEAESHLSSQGMAGLTSSMPKSSDRKWEEQATSSHLAQLQSMGMPIGAMSGLGSSFNPSDILKKDKETGSDKKSAEASNKDLMNMDPAQVAAMMSSPFSGFFPGMDPAMLPYMYAGFPGFSMPGMSMPFMPPGFMPGAEQMMGYDPMSFGTPLPLLQIPPQAIKDVSVKLSEPKASVAQYTQDCKGISSLKSLVNNVDYLCVRESTVDVGYICKKCQMVYPGKEACATHQRTMCFAGGKIPDNISPILKLEQIQYECKLCSDKSSTVQEYKSHCQTEGHKAKTDKLHNKSGKDETHVTPSKMVASNPNVSTTPKSEQGSAGLSQPKADASNAD